MDLPGFYFGSAKVNSPGKRLVKIYFRVGTTYVHVLIVMRKHKSFIFSKIFTFLEQKHNVDDYIFCYGSIVISLSTYVLYNYKQHIYIFFEIPKRIYTG